MLMDHCSFGRHLMLYLSIRAAVATRMGVGVDKRE